MLVRALSLLLWLARRALTWLIRALARRFLRSSRLKRFAWLARFPMTAAWLAMFMRVRVVTVSDLAAATLIITLGSKRRLGILPTATARLRASVGGRAFSRTATTTASPTPTAPTTALLAVASLAASLPLGSMGHALTTTVRSLLTLDATLTRAAHRFAQAISDVITDVGFAACHLAGFHPIAIAPVGVTAITTTVSVATVAFTATCFVAMALALTA